MASNNNFETSKNVSVTSNMMKYKSTIGLEIFTPLETLFLTG